MITVSDLLSELDSKKNIKKAVFLSRFFKTGKGEYAQGDVFLGITVPVQRAIIKKYYSLSLTDLQKLLNSKVHEHRLSALYILVGKYQQENPGEKEKIFRFYLKNTKKINNWDLVDSSAPYIIGKHLEQKEKKILYRLAKSPVLWERRIAIIATLAFIKSNSFADTLKIGTILLKDNHDLIHKAVGWLLREVGKRSLSAEEKFLLLNYQKMPRTMLRYAIEKFPRVKRNFYLAKN